MVWSSRSSKLAVGVVLLVFASARPAHALTCEVTTKGDSLVGETFAFSATVADVSGQAHYRWSFGDGEETEFAVDQSQVEHVYTAAARNAGALAVKDDSGSYCSSSFFHVSHYPLTELHPSQSATIVYDSVLERVYNVNQDNDTISAVDPLGLTKVAELPVYRDPEALALAPNGKLWVLHRDDYAIAIVEPAKFEIERGFRLPYRSQPIGLAMSPTGDAAYVTLMATGKLLKLDPESGEVLAELAVGAWPRGVSVSADGQQVLVTRFISDPNIGGQVTLVDAGAFAVKSTYVLTPDTTTEDTDRQGRGLPNYLFSSSISPDGRTAWISAKKDNIFRGLARPEYARPMYGEPLPLNRDNTVRPMISVLDLSQATEQQADRIDIDDRNLPSFVEFSPLGDFAFVTLTGSNRIEVFEGYSKSPAAQPLTSLTDAGLAPRSTVIGPQNRLFVQGSMGRSVVVYDLTTVLDSSDVRSIKIADIAVVAHEKLPPDILLGKQVFSNAADGRMTGEGYLTCITCHFDAGDDGQVYDFTSRGEGLRNTISLKGKRGMGQGNLLWSGALDEVQDFEAEIRELFGGHGFIADGDLAQGTRALPLGEPKRGLSKELDALAAYLATLDQVDPSPFRNADGSMTADAVSGEALFRRLGCDFCHVGPDYTDSGRRRLHDVGTLQPIMSDARTTQRGQDARRDLDTPSLLGVWRTAPYLHDGSAATLLDVLSSQNPTEMHGATASLNDAERTQLVAFLQQLDGDPALRRLPFEEDPTTKKREGGCSMSGRSPTDTSWLLLVLLALAESRRRVRRTRSNSRLRLQSDLASRCALSRVAWALRGAAT